MLATPPGFRPQHIEATIKAGKHLFTEKPVAVDGTGIRKVLAAYEEANKKGLSVVAGTQRRHQAATSRAMKRIHEGRDRRHRRRPSLLERQGAIWAHKRQPGWSDTEYQIRNWYHFLWLCGDHIVEQHVHNLDVACWALRGHPVKARRHGRPPGDHASPSAARATTTSRSITSSPTASTCSPCAARSQAAPATSRRPSSAPRASGTAADIASPAEYESRVRVPNEVNPYVQEHIDLLESIISRKPVNELKQVAESTLTAIMGRMSAYTGKAVTWDQALNSKLDTFPKTPGHEGPMAEPPVPRPGVTELI